MTDSNSATRKAFIYYLKSVEKLKRVEKNQLIKNANARSYFNTASTDGRRPRNFRIEIQRVESFFFSLPSVSLLFFKKEKKCCIEMEKIYTEKRTYSTQPSLNPKN